MYRPSIPPNNHLPVEKQHEITENLVYWCDKWHYDSPETRRYILKMLDRTFRIGSILEIIDK
jgi:hypothetical protein